MVPMPCTTPRNTMQGWGAHQHTCPKEPHSLGPFTPTSPIAVAEVWEAPDVAKAHGIAHAGQHKLDLVAPVATLDALLLLALLPRHGAVLQRDVIGCVNWGPPCWPCWKGDSRQVGLGGPRHPSPSCPLPHTGSAKEGEGSTVGPPQSMALPRARLQQRESLQLIQSRSRRQSTKGPLFSCPPYPVPSEKGPAGWPLPTT